jgi:hypothetical protein
MGDENPFTRVEKSTPRRVSAILPRRCGIAARQRVAKCLPNCFTI